VVTDRDFVIRTVAADRDPRRTTLGEICSRVDLATIDPSEPVEVAIALMAQRAIRRLPVVENGRRGDGVDREPGPSAATGNHSWARSVRRRAITDRSAPLC
jgi:CBS domain-containing protein